MLVPDGRLEKTDIAERSTRNILEGMKRSTPCILRKEDPEPQAAPGAEAEVNPDAQDCSVIHEKAIYSVDDFAERVFMDRNAGS